MATQVLAKEQSNEMITDLLKWATGKAPVEVRFDDMSDNGFAIITLYDYKGEQELSLRLHPDELYDIHLGYYDEEDDFIEIVTPLTAEQQAMLPEKLKKVMSKVLDDESGLRVPGSLLA